MSQLIDGSPADDAELPTDQLELNLRAFVQRAPKPPKGSQKADQKKPGRPRPPPERAPPSPWVLVFDCETRTTPDQQLRFGAYQLRYEGQIWESGLFYEPDALTPDELECLRAARAEEEAASDNGRVFLWTRAEFVEQVFYDRGFLLGAQIVGFNLPFDVSRLAIAHHDAQRGMKGGFTFTLSEKRRYPDVAVKHLSAKSAFIQFVGVSGFSEETDEYEPDQVIEDRRRNADRGYFVDLKTLAATLTSQSHSLASLTATLKTPTRKEESDEHGQALTPAYVRYGLRDVQATYECFEILTARFAELGLAETGTYELYSEASLGKAYLKAMRVRPFRETTPDFPPELTGQILSAYYGGRAEVHIRRETVEVLHCDFLSMYPTTCTLMGLWRFVRADGISWRDDTARVRALVRSSTAETLRDKAAWQGLPVIVQVRPKRDLFPVRAVYLPKEPATIGLNYLTSDESLWFTLADVLASKVLTGRAPEVLQAIRFTPGKAQTGLRPVAVARRSLDPAGEDFYRSLINHRQALKAEAARATDPDHKSRLESDQQATKILANATSYGIFVELNVEDSANPRPMIGHDVGSAPFALRSTKHEKPGRYFHPLLGALITGAARLMLALAERQVIGQGLDWAFCDTDSLAIANVGLPTEEFRRRALAVAEWFGPLNPYDDGGSILQVEKVNYGKAKDGQPMPLERLFCFAVSAKRYVLFNRGPDGAPVIRKASGHGLGHLLAPYDEPPEARRERIRRIGVPLWQEDLWLQIIRAADAGTPDQVPLGHMPGYDAPAASQYAATSPHLLKWFDGYNTGRPYGQQIRPFNFLLSLQLGSDPQLGEEDMDALIARLDLDHVPRAAAPYFKRPVDAASHAFDRKTGAPIPAELLKSHARSLVLYHVHREGKFLGGDYGDRGTLRRRHVQAIAFRAIGKEADKIEPRELIGDDEGQIEYALSPHERERLAEHVRGAIGTKAFSEAGLARRAHVSPHTIRDLKAARPVTDAALDRMARTVRELGAETGTVADEDAAWLRWANERMVEAGGRNALARKVGLDPPYLGRVLSGQMPVTDEVRGRFAQAFRSPLP